ncbi:MAG: hypothetical protein AAGJ79_08425, partial [Verrucomicrobiota bacterium]
GVRVMVAEEDSERAVEVVGEFFHSLRSEPRTLTVPRFGLLIFLLYLLHGGAPPLFFGRREVRSD